MSKIVMRCRHCQLNQFAAGNGDCRKCHKPLFTLEMAMPKQPTKKEPPPRLAGCIKMIREFRHMSQAELAEKLDCPRTWISKLENNTEPTMKTLLRLSAVFDVPVWLVVEPDPVVVSSYFHVGRISEANRNELLKWAELRAA